MPSFIVRLSLAWLCMASIAQAQFLAIELRTIDPPLATIGQKASVSVAGENMDEVDQLWFSHPGITATIQSVEPATPAPLLEPTPKYGNFHVTVAADVSPGRYEVRAVGRHGVSNPRTFWVTSLPIGNATISHDRSVPTPLPRDTWVHATSLANAIHYYAVEIAAPSTTICYRSQTSDSPMIGQCKLYNSAGKVVASARGADGFDPEMVITDQPAGQYVLAVREFLYRSGPPYAYQLSVQSTPELANPEHQAHAAFAFPHAATALNVVSDPQPGRTDTDMPQRIDLPHQATWWFASANEVNTFEFEVTESESIAIDVISDRLGQPTDARIIVDRISRDEAGAVTYHPVTRVDDSQVETDGVVSLRTKDPSMVFTAPATATYRLTVQDLDIGTSLREDQWFVLRVGKPNPGFTLVAYRVYPHKDNNQSKPHGSKLFRGGAEHIRVFALRRDGWTGSIEVSAENLPAGVHCEPVTIAANQTQADLTLSAAEDAAGGVTSIRVVGHNVDKTITETAVATTLQLARGGGRDSIRSRITSEVVVAVSEEDVSPLTMRLGDASVADVKVAEALSVGIQLTRREGGNDACVLRPISLPPGVTIAEVTVPADQSEATCTIQTSAKTPAGIYSLSLMAETKIKVRPNPQSLAQAEEARAQLQSLHDDPTQAANLDAIKAAIVEADKRVEAAKKAAAEQTLTVFIPTNLVTFRVVVP
ncbi:hypothetical protein Pla52o_24670 [Novipirellula galeiformis]|uniref:Peptidase C-terminal archaeal/bacterial domain-containing protein n=1 Tax=Novipirellula galeiformis TaxID=2528004 RepID=A0A5C6CH91_9BACT|nr:hypothetical protein [Novipirellula galeiformis]TWU22934.1 hypothetical protein Pla52o_24670 [Novipirellula galeiformis]